MDVAALAACLGRVLGLLHVLLGDLEGAGDLTQRQRDRLDAVGADEPGHGRGVADDAPRVVVHVHPHEHVAGQELLVGDDLLALLVLGHLLGGDDDLVDAVPGVVRLDAVGQVVLDPLLVPGVGVHDEPAALHQPQFLLVAHLVDGGGATATLARLVGLGLLGDGGVGVGDVLGGVGGCLGAGGVVGDGSLGGLLDLCPGHAEQVVELVGVRVVDRLGRAGVGRHCGLLGGDGLVGGDVLGLGASGLGHGCLGGTTVELARRGLVLGTCLGRGDVTDGLATRLIGERLVAGLALVAGLDVARLARCSIEVLGSVSLVLGHACHPNTLRTALEISQSTPHTIVVRAAVVTSTTAVYDTTSLREGQLTLRSS